jgi:hypothetical protein
VPGRQRGDYVMWTAELCVVCASARAREAFYQGCSYAQYYVKRLCTAKRVFTQSKH